MYNISILIDFNRFVKHHLADSPLVMELKWVRFFWYEEKVDEFLDWWEVYKVGSRRC